MQRRTFLQRIGLAAAATAVITPRTVLAAEAPKGPNAMSIDSALKAITGGKAVTPSKKVHLKAPEIAENGAVVPVTVEVDSPMTNDDYVKAIHVFATKNSNVRCADIMLTPANGAAMFATRIKLGSSQDVLVVAETSKGEFLSAKQSVKVTIGGCG
ncbi:MAG: thiosulfate oxidation carrier protein SoxY [Campylobacterales bacterium]|jgi:sulfur-oxidizing protein SoxY